MHPVHLLQTIYFCLGNNAVTTDRAAFLRRARYELWHWTARHFVASSAPLYSPLRRDHERHSGLHLPLDVFLSTLCSDDHNFLVSLKPSRSSNEEPNPFGLYWSRKKVDQLLIVSYVPRTNWFLCRSQCGLLVTTSSGSKVIVLLIHVIGHAPGHIHHRLLLIQRFNY